MNTQKAPAKPASTPALLRAALDVMQAWGHTDTGDAPAYLNGPMEKLRAAATAEHAALRTPPAADRAREIAQLHSHHKNRGRLSPYIAVDKLADAIATYGAIRYAEGEAAGAAREREAAARIAESTADAIRARTSP